MGSHENDYIVPALCYRAMTIQSISRDMQRNFYA